MNRRDFLRIAGTSAAGAAGTVLVSNTAAQSLLREGRAIISEADVKSGKIITQAEMIEEQVNIAQFGDNLAKIVLNSRNGVSITPMRDRENMFQVWADLTIPYENEEYFTQHQKYKIVHGGGGGRM